MNIRWRLRMAAAQREVWTGTELRRLLADKAGLEMSAASDPKLVAVAFGMAPEAAMIYLADHVDPTRLPNP
jgi:hypothetical protein